MDKVDFKARDKGVYVIIIQGSVKQYFNLCAVNSMVTKYMKQKLTKLKKICTQIHMKTKKNMYTDSYVDVRL